MSRAWATWLAPALVVAALAACGSAPRKPPPPSVAVRIENHGEFDARGQARKRSPYAPAQEDPGKRGDYTRGGLYAPHIQDSAPSGGIPDIDLIPEPAVADEPRSRYGNRSPYTVLGKSYRVRDSARGYDETGLASYYGNKFHGRRTSNLEVYDMYAFSAAHKTLPLPSYARVTNLSNGRSVVVRVNDRGPFHDGRIIDLSYAAAVKLGVDRTGTARVEVVGLSPGEDARQHYDAVADNTGAPAAATTAGLQLGPSTPAAPALGAGVHVATGRPQPAPPSALDKLVGALPIAVANAGERPPQRGAAAAPAAPAADGADRYANTDWRFDMRQDGRTMTADEFDAWMRSRRARVATGKPGTPDPRLPAPAGNAPAANTATAATSARAPAAPVASADRHAMPPPRAAATAAPASAASLTLQVASFAAHDNAERALAMLNGAGISGARLLDADADGRRVWRLRVGPVDPAAAPELVARIQRLGFGQPQRVRE
jgi:rare lipoprotein A